MTNLEDLKALDVRILEVAEFTSITDFMIFASGRSDRQVRALAEKVLREVRKAVGIKPLGVEGQVEAEWILLDYNDVIVHVMLPSMREYYQLEQFWEGPRPHDS